MRTQDTDGAQGWRRTVAVIGLSQFFSIMGFAFAMPFAPYYIQHLGVVDPESLALWVAFFAAATPLSMAVASPIWGALADRYGRRLMLLRANFCAWVVVTLMGFVPGVGWLIVLRVGQGLFTGTMTAAQAMVAGHAPDRRSGAALGALSAATFSGAMVGSLLGGVCAHWLGYRIAFVVSGSLLLIAALLVLFGTRETWTPPARAPGEPSGSVGRAVSGLGVALPILLTILGIAWVRQFDAPYLPLLVQDINGGLEGASLWAGLLNGVGGVAGFVSGIVLGRLADRYSPPTIGVFSALGAALLIAPQAWAFSFAPLLALRFGMVFCGGGLEPVFQIWLSKRTPAARRGVVFGWAGTARALGWMFAPLMSGWVASRYGVRPIFLVGTGLYILLVPLILYTVHRVSHSRTELSDPI